MSTFLALLPFLSLASPPSAGELFASNFTAGAVDTFDAASGAPTGPFKTGVSSAAGIAFTPSGTLLVASGSSIRAFDGQCGTDIGVFASGGGLNQARDIAFGPNGNLFVANRQGNNVLEYDGATGAFVGVFASTDLSAPIGLAFRASGNLLVTSLNTDKVVEFDGTTGAKVQTLPTGAELDGPVALLLRANGNLLVSSSLNDQVIEYTPAGALIGTFAQGAGLDNPIGLAFDAAGDLLVASGTTGEILRFDGASGAFLGVFATPGPQPWDLAFGPDAPALPTVPGFDVTAYATGVPGPFVLDFGAAGELYAGRQTDPVTGVTAPISRIAGDGSWTSWGAAPTLDPDVVVFDAAGVVSGVPGSVIVGGICGATVDIGCLHRIAPDQSVTTLLGPTTLVGNPYNLEFDGLGRLICTDDTQSKILVIGPGASTVTTLAALSTPATGLAIDGSNRIYASNANGTVQRHASDGTLLDAAFATGLGPNPPLAIGPGGPCFGADLYAINPLTGDLVRVLPNGNQVVVGVGFANDQSDLAFGPDGALYVSQVCTGRVVRIAPSLQALQTPRFGTPPNPPALLAGTTPPVIGATWNPRISHASFVPGAVLDVLGITLGPLNVPVPPYGTLLCNPAVTIATVTSPASVPFAVAIPPTCLYVGLSLCSQGVSVDALGGIAFANALDVTIGTY